jgi:hypothetical protein
MGKLKMVISQNSEAKNKKNRGRNSVLLQGSLSNQMYTMENSFNMCPIPVSV